MAHAKLAVVYNNLGLFDKRDEYAKQALARIDRLTTRERYYIEGFLLRAPARDTRHEVHRTRTNRAWRCTRNTTPSRHNLGLPFLSARAVARKHRAVRRTEAARHLQPRPPMRTSPLRISRTARPASARQVAEGYRCAASGDPEGLSGASALRSSRADRLDEALGQYREVRGARAARFRPEAGPPRRFACSNTAGRSWSTLKPGAAEIAQPVPEVPGAEPARPGSAARAAAARRRSRPMGHGARVPGSLDLEHSAFARNRQAAAPAADQQARRGARAGRNSRVPDATGPRSGVRDPPASRHRAGRGRTTGGLRQIAGAPRVTRRDSCRRSGKSGVVHWTRGQIALDRGDRSRGGDRVTDRRPHAAARRPGAWSAFELDRTAVRCRGDGHLKAGQDAEAAALLERLQASSDLVFDPTPTRAATSCWVRSTSAGRTTPEPARSTTRFLDLWRDGDMERGWVAEAQKKIQRGSR